MPSDELRRFEIFIGTWNTTGEVLETDAAPATTLVATDVYRWLPGRRFIVHDVDARFGGEPSRSMEVMGYDRKRRKHVSRSYDDTGATEEFDLALSGRQWRISGATVRFDGKFSKRGDKLTGLWELKSKRSGWQPWLELKLVRA